MLIPGRAAYGLDASPTTTRWSPGAAASADRSARSSGAYSAAASEGAAVVQRARWGARNSPEFGSFQALR